VTYRPVVIQEITPFSRIKAKAGWSKPISASTASVDWPNSWPGLASPGK
jgi:hypothetical protein